MGAEYVAFYERSLWVYLPAEEIDYAIRHGMKLRITSVARNHKNHKGYDPDDKKAMRVQCLGSLVEAIVRFGLHIDAELGSETFNVPDLPGKIQARLIGREHYGLRVYPQDPDDWRVVGAVVPEGRERSGCYRVPGWCLAGWAKRKEWEMAPHGRPPMWCVPQKFLRDPVELITGPPVRLLSSCGPRLNSVEA